eukprot:825227_1
MSQLCKEHQLRVHSDENQTSLFFQCDASSCLANFVQFCLKSICPSHQQNEECVECAPNIANDILSFLHELTDIDGNNISSIHTCSFSTFINTTVSAYSSNDRLYFIKSLSLIIQHTHIQSTVHQFTIQLLSQIMSSNANWCSRLSDDIKLINFVIKHTIHADHNAMVHQYELLLQCISKNIVIRKTTQIKSLVETFINCIISDDQCDEYTLPKLIVLYNIIIKSKDSSSIQRYIKSLSNLKKFYKQLSRLMSNQNMWIVLYSLFILAKLVVHDPLQSQLFNDSNINIVFHLVFNLILHGASTDIRMFDISVELLSLMLSNDELFEYLSHYPKLQKSIQKLLPLSLVFTSHDEQHPSHALLVLKLLNVLIQSTKMQSIVMKLLSYNRYLSVILKLCLYYSDFNISIQAIKLMTVLIKSPHLNLTEILITNSHHYPRHADRVSQSLNNSNHSLSFSTSFSSTSFNLSSIECNDEFIGQVRRMCFVEDTCNTLFGHTEMNGNQIMKKLCFAGHIEDYSLLTQSQKYMMYLIELINLLCRESNAFKSRLVELINIGDVSYFLCPSRNGSHGEPNQIWMSVVNLICSFDEDMEGIAYLLKTSLCDSSLISAISDALNSKSNSKDISNAMQFIHNIFKMLSKQETYNGNNSFISNLLQSNQENDASKRKVRRRNAKQKPRHYERSGLTLSNVEQEKDAATTVSNMTHSTDCLSTIQDNNVQNMSSKRLYQLFCKKMVRFNKTHKGNRSKLFEKVKAKYSKTVHSLEQKVQSKDTELEQMQVELERINTTLSNKSNDFRGLREEFEDLNSHLMEIQDDNQTKKHIIKDKTEKMERMKMDYKQMKEKYEADKRGYVKKNDELQNEAQQLRQSMDEIMNQLKCVCEGYNQLKQDSKRQMDELEQKKEQMIAAIQRKHDETEQKLKRERQNVIRLQNELKHSEMNKAELKKNLDSMIGRNSELTRKCNELIANQNESNKEISHLHRKLSETQKLAAMIQNLMPSHTNHKNSTSMT